MLIKEMTSEECAALLTSSRFGRLACSKDNQPYVVPITFVFEHRHIYSFSLEGQKADWMRANPQVCLLVDRVSEAREWQSVLVYGAFEELPDRIGWKRERDHAWALLSKHASWWEPGGLKPSSDHQATPAHLFYRINVDTITGRQAEDA